MAKQKTFPGHFGLPHIDAVGLQTRIARFRSRSIKKEAKIEGLKRVLSMIDLTTLEGADTPGKVRQMCFKAAHLHDAYGGLPHVAAVCVYPSLVRIAKKSLAGTGVNVASVATAFPSGQTSLVLRLEEVKYAVDEGADEIDMVINRGALLSGRQDEVFEEIAAVKAACGKSRLKVILETGELGSYARVRQASEIAIAAGADFIKTSTGKIKPAATFPDTLVMLETIRDHHLKTNQMIGMKPAGGISDSKTALHYLVMVKETLGDDWLDPQWFRFGASRLANDVLRQLLKEQTGNYQAAQYFSID